MPPQKAAAKKSRKSAQSSSKTPPARRWSANVDTDSTHPGPGLFAKGARIIIHALASGMRMLNFYTDRTSSGTSRRYTVEISKPLVTS